MSDNMSQKRLDSYSSIIRNTGIESACYGGYCSFPVVALNSRTEFPEFRSVPSDFVLFLNSVEVIPQCSTSRNRMIAQYWHVLVPWKTSENIKGTSTKPVQSDWSENSYRTWLITARPAGLVSSLQWTLLEFQMLETTWRAKLEYPN